MGTTTTATTPDETAARPDDPAGRYRARRDRFAAERDALTRRWNRVANLRLVTFLAGASLAGWGLWTGRPPAVVAGAVLLGGFLALASHHGALGRQRRRAGALAELNAEAALRVERTWDDLPVHHTARATPDHPFAVDLDLFGPASLAHLLDTPTTPMGEATLARWLLAPADVGTIRARQAAVADLAGRLDLRQELEARGRLRLEARPDPTLFLVWAESRTRAIGPALGSLAWVLPLAFWALVAAQATGRLAGLWVLPLGLAIAVSQTIGRRVHAELTTIAGQEAPLLGYAGQLELLTAAPLTAPALAELRARLGGTAEPAHRQLGRIHRLAGMVVPAGSLVYLPLQAVTLWDIHLLAALERWRARSGDHVRDWLVALGEAEALAALGTLAADNPDWCFPEIDPAAGEIVARGLGHPLLAAGVRVGNDLTVGPPGTMLLVTGSNMSGKSTLLRAIGVNAVLAQAGGPVCAAGLRLPTVTIATSMHIQDSLARGVSYFMAELQRLKSVVDAARAQVDSDRRLLFLLDEILHGTNTAERQIAARRIIRHLVGTGAIGAVSTHDLGLADAPELAPIARPIHFRETVHLDAGGGVPPMSFDYRARPGVATSTNALRLMALVGLDLADEFDQRPGDAGSGVDQAAGVAMTGSAPQPASSTSSGRG